MNPLFFLMWISSGTIQVQGIITGSLGGGDMSIERGCSALADLQTKHVDAHLFRIEKSNIGGCDWGCEYPVDVYEVECKQQTIPAKTETIAVPK